MTHDWSAWGMPLVVTAIGLVMGLFASRRVLVTDEEHARTLADGRREDVISTRPPTPVLMRQHALCTGAPFTPSPRIRAGVQPRSVGEDDDGMCGSGARCLRR